MEKFLELEQDQILKYNDKELRIISRMKFTESNYYWFEYILMDVADGKKYYFDVEPYGRLAIFEIINENIPVEFSFNYNGEKFDLKQKGHARIETYYGSNDVGLNDEVEYYEYQNSNGHDKIIYIEKWKKEIEISIGHEVKTSEIKIEKRNNDGWIIS